MEGLVRQKIANFFMRYPAKHFDKQELLVEANAEPPGIIHLVNGQVRQYDISDQGNEIVVNVFKAPAFFPMAWAITGTPNQYFFDAATDVDVHIAPPKETVAFLQQNPDVMYDLLARLYSGTEGLQRRMAHLMGGTAHTRLLFEIVTECKRFGTKQTGSTYALSLHEDELARRSGLTRETVNREIMQLKRSGLLMVEHKQLIIPDLARLEQELGENL